MPNKPGMPAERAHKDGIVVTEDSPEAFEEPLWTAFFPKLHDPETSAFLDGDTSHPTFEPFYRDHIRKILMVRGGKRYLSKGNYNLTRLAYLQKMFGDARFVIPLRTPAWHIASLIKQHRLFSKNLKDNIRAQHHMRRVGHFEFGPDRRPINAGGEDGAVEAIQDLWNRGEEVEGQARYWAYLHGRIAQQLETVPALRAATLVVRYEDLCKEPETTIQTLFDHCGLGLDEAHRKTLAEKVQFPTYYQPDFSDAERQMIDDITGPVAARFDALCSHQSASADQSSTAPASPVSRTG